MAAAAAYRPSLSRALTDYMTSKQTTYNIPISGPDYHTVCGREVGATNGTPSPTGSRVLDQFKEQIGCPSTGGPIEWIAERDKYKEQFNKAKLCFSGRVRGLQGHVMRTNANRHTRKKHAYAAQAAYVLGRNCLRKIADVPTALSRYNSSARALVNAVSAEDPGIKENLDAEFPINSYREHITTNPKVDDTMPVNPALKEIYEETYNLSPEEWELYHKYLQYSTLTADNYVYDNTNIHAGIPTITNVTRAFNKKFRSPSEEPPAEGPLTGATSDKPNTFSTKKQQRKKNTRKRQTARAKKGVTGGGSARPVNVNVNVNVNSLVKNMAAMKLDHVPPPATVSLPKLETIAGDATVKLTDDARKISYNLTDMNKWMSAVMKLIETLQKKENHTPINVERFTRSVLMPYHYYRTYGAIRAFQLNYITNGSALFSRSNFITRYYNIAHKIFPKIKILGSTLEPDIFTINTILHAFKTHHIDPIISLSDVETLKRDYLALENYTDTKLLKLFEANKKNPDLITINDVWPYITPIDTPTEIQYVIQQLKHLKIPITTNLFRHTAT